MHGRNYTERACYWAAMGLRGIDMDWIDVGKVGLSSAAFGISCLALWISHRNWLRSNCPIVVACIETATAEDGAFIAYNLVVVNTGNRPAVNVRLYCSDTELEQCIQPGPHAGKRSGSTWTHVKKCFQEDAEIPVLLNGKSVSNSFGFTGVNQQSLLEIQFPIENHTAIC